MVDVRGAQLWCEVAGEGPWLVMLHGHLIDSGQWDDQFAALADHFHVVRYDARGFGRSSQPTGPFSFADDLHAVMLGLEIDRAFLMGCSGGGATVVDFALGHPEMARALVLVDSGMVGHRYEGEVPPKMIAQRQARERGDLEEAVELGLQLHTDGRRRPDQVDARARERTREMMLRQLRRGEVAAEARWLEPPAASRLRELRMPVLAIVGAEDLPPFHQIADRLVAEAPSARKVVIPEAGHHPNMEHPARFDEIVRSFLTEVG